MGTCNIPTSTITGNIETHMMSHFTFNLEAHTNSFSRREKAIADIGVGWVCWENGWIFMGLDGNGWTWMDLDGFLCVWMSFYVSGWVLTVITYVLK